MKWICCQLGAREHYAIPRALFHLRALASLVTDAWVPPSSFIAKMSGRGSNLADRFHHELRDAPVAAFNASLIWFEMLARARRLQEWETIIARNRWFQRKVLALLRSQHLNVDQRPIFLSYSYAALEPFRYAKSCGWKTVLIQIDPGPEEERIVAEEIARVPKLAGTWQPAPAEYWTSWREECRLAEAIVVNSEWSLEGIARSGIPRDKLTVISLAYEMPDVGPRPSETIRTRQYPARFTQERPMRVLFLGQVNLRKGVARLLEAAEILRDAPVEFWIVGSVQIPNAEALAKNARVKWFGPVKRNQAAEKYRAADVFILPTLSDGFAITQLEAQAHGLPIISSRFCGGVVEDGRNGIILEEPNAASIASAVRGCIANPSRLQQFAAASRLPDEFTIDALAQRLQKLGSAL
jgi:glycosyltransferase involved in cell wall biosynthesis